MTTTPAVRKIPLHKLVLSPTNVRKVPPSAAEDAELKASIRARGLMQNLVVHPAVGDGGIHAVVAGGRRLKALQELAAEGAIAADYKVPCLVDTADAALETSLMENTIRAAMHPADEFVAMAGLIEAGVTTEGVTTRFGVSEQHVRQRLRLGKLAPELLDAYRDGAVSLEVIMAFTLGADHAAQLAVWRQVKDQNFVSVHAVRRLLTEAAEDEAAIAPPDTTSVVGFTRRKPVRAPLPAHLPRERVVMPAPSACPCCGGKLAKLGEDITETLEVVPRQWKVIQTVREKFTCRRCERITQPPAPFHPIARARAGASLLAMILYAKFGEHQPLNRQSASYAREGIELDTSTLADWVGACAATLMPLVELIRRHVLAAERIHGDDTTVPVLAKNKTATARLWTYVRDDRPFGGPDPPAAIFYYSRNRNGEHPARHLAGYAGILQADAYAGFGELYDGKRRPGPITEAACWAHGRRNFFELADLRKAPLASEAVRRIDAIFAIEREINGMTPDRRRAARQERIVLLACELKGWMETERVRLSRHAATAKAIDYMLKRWPAFTRFLDDGRICLTNNAAERALRGIAIGRKAWLFAGSDRGGERAAAMFTLIETAKLNGVDPQAWLADVLGRIADHPAVRLADLLPWNWKIAAMPVAA